MTKPQTMIYKTLHRKHMIERNEPKHSVKKVLHDEQSLINITYDDEKEF